MGLMEAFTRNMSNPVFGFLLSQADRGDLEQAKKERYYKEYEQFRLAIDEALKTAGPAGTRHERFFDRTITAMKVFSERTRTPDTQGPSCIIASYLVSDEVLGRIFEWMKSQAKESGEKDGQVHGKEEGMGRDENGQNQEVQKSRRKPKRRRQRKSKQTKKALPRTSEKGS